MKKPGKAATAASEPTPREVSGEIADKALEQASGGSFSFGMSATSSAIKAIGEAIVAGARKA